MIITNPSTDRRQQQDWFENVENFRPLRGGRRAGTLNEVATGETKVTVEEAEKKFLKEFAEAGRAEDPLERMCKFVTWFEEHFPSGKQHYFYPILYKICITYSSTPKWKDDDRLLKVWLKLAENFPESGLAVMEFAFARGSCRSLAKFYIHWSEMYQSIGWWNKAREKLQLGVRMCAMPIDWLHRAQDELEACVMRATCVFQQEEEESNGDEFAQSMEMTREILGKLRGIGRRHIVPVVRVPQGPPGTLLATARTRKPASSRLDKFHVFSEEEQANQQRMLEEESCLAFQTPRIVKKRSRVAESLAHDLDYQALFGAYIGPERCDLQLTNEENDLRTSGLGHPLLMNSTSRPPTTVATTSPERPDRAVAELDAFDVFQEEEEEAGKTDNKKQGKEGTDKSSGGKVKLRLRKELVRALSIEEDYARRVMEQFHVERTEDIGNQVNAD